MKYLRKNIALTRVLLALFIVPLFAPVGIAASTHERKIDGINSIIICTTTGLKLVTATGEIVPIGEHKNSILNEHCKACFLSGFAGNIDREYVGLISSSHIIQSNKKPRSFHLTFSSWTNSYLGARAPPV